MTALLLAAALVQVAPPGIQDLGVATATTYWPGDGMSGPRVGCRGWARRHFGTSDFAALLARGVPLVAHRTLPCGTLVLLATKRGAALGVVGDRGPFGQNGPHGYRVGLRLCPGCRWRGAWDLTPVVAAEAALRGRGRWRRGPVRALALGRVSHAR